MGFAFILAQVATTDQTSKQINLLILALLVVAFLLACLTVWYWRHTSPSRRQPVAVSSAPTPVEEPLVLPQEPEALADAYAQDEGLSVDEWLSLTGPETPGKN